MVIVLSPETAVDDREVWLDFAISRWDPRTRVRDGIPGLVDADDVWLDRVHDGALVDAVEVHSHPGTLCVGCAGGALLKFLELHT